jgi:opacity protein-like surface antigen
MSVLLKTVALSFGLALSAAAASAQTPMELGVGAGLSIPTGTTSNGLKTGWHGLALVQFKPASSPVGIRIEGSYNHLGFDGGGGKDQIVAGTANAVYEFATSAESQFHPYVVAGGGIYNVKAKPDFGASVSDTKFGVNVGAGFNFRSSGIGFFVEGRFHDILVSGPDFHFIPLTAGVRFGG